MPRTVLMGDPRYFSVLGGANPHTRTFLGTRKKVNAQLARAQWHKMARTLVEHGVEVCIIEPLRNLTGLVYPANAGILYPPQGRSKEKIFYLANLLPTRAAEREVYCPFITGMGYSARDMRSRFEGEADFFPAGGAMIFTYGALERQRFVARIGIPPWRRIYGFRSEAGALRELQEIVENTEILAIRLCDEAFYHGDTVFCSFGPHRGSLLAYLRGVSPESRGVLRERFGAHLIELSEHDARLYAANAFQTDFAGKLYLFLPEGVSDELLAAVRERRVEPVTVDVSEFLAKGGGSIKCMILDLGPSDEQPERGAGFRAQRSYLSLHGASVI